LWLNINKMRAARPIVVALLLQQSVVDGFVSSAGPTSVALRSTSAKIAKCRASCLQMVATERPAAVSSMSLALHISTERKHVDIYDTTLRDGTQVRLNAIFPVLYLLP
jgi:hypothetical protein